MYPISCTAFVDVVDVMARNKVKIIISMDFRLAYHQIRVRAYDRATLTSHAVVDVLAGN